MPQEAHHPRRYSRLRVRDGVVSVDRAGGVEGFARRVRGADGGRIPQIVALSAFWVGLLYDAAALDAAWSLVKDWTDEDRQKLRDDVPADVVEKERATLETLSRNEGKPEAALPKIVEGRLGGFFKDVVLLEQPYAKDDKQSIQQFIGKAGVVRFAQVEIG